MNFTVKGMIQVIELNNIINIILKLNVKF